MQQESMQFLYETISVLTTLERSDGERNENLMKVRLSASYMSSHPHKHG